MREFTFKSIEKLYKTFLVNDYKIMSYLEYLKLSKKPDKFVILRHDVDRFPLQSLKMAVLENNLGFKSTYYFRTRSYTFKPHIISKIAKMGHEIGYHYENYSDCNGDHEKSIVNFKLNLNLFDKYFDVKTICMHGSPLSKWDNKKIWDNYDYKDYGIIADTSFDIDYNDIFYITDNGWGWNNEKVSVRDKVNSNFDIIIKNTDDLINKINQNTLPNKIMINAHPDTFFQNRFKWLLNKIFIKSKNIIKREIVRFKILR